MKIKRVFTINETDPYHGISFEKRKSEIKRKNSFEVITGSLSKVKTLNEAENEISDKIIDDTALFINLGNDEVLIVTGCCHAGIINTLTVIEPITGRENINTIIGGLHLIGASKERLNFTVDELKNYKIKKIYSGHCTGFNGCLELKKLYKESFDLLHVGKKIEIKA